MKITGKGVIIVKVNETFNYFNYENNEELKELISRFYKVQNINDITIVDCEDKEVIFVDTEEDYKNLIK